jgi:nickel superoxide dismutase
LIAELAGKSDAQSQNQLVRWVMNKENHAQKIISTISDYFLTQRVKLTQLFNNYS